MINWERVAELQEEVGTEDFEEVVEMFFEEVEEAILGLDGAQNIAATLHFLKGSALNLGFTELAGLCAAAETETDTLNVAAIQSAFSAAKSEFAGAF